MNLPVTIEQRGLKAEHMVAKRDYYWKAEEARRSRTGNSQKMLGER